MCCAHVSPTKSAIGNALSVSRLVNILFPELEKLLPTLHTASSYALLSELPSAKHIADVHLTHLTNLLYTASKGRYNRDRAIQIRETARNSIGTYMPAKALELKHTIKLIRELDSEIDEINIAIKEIMDKIDSPIISIPGVGLNMAAMIIAEIGDFNNFDSPDKILAFSGLSPSTYQSASSIIAMLTWKNEVLDIYDMLFLMLPSSFVIGTLFSSIILQKTLGRPSITMLLFLTLPRNWFV